MSNKQRFVWIDDNPKRQADSENLADQLGVKEL